MADEPAKAPDRMAPNLIEAALAFLDRTTLRGDEAEALVAVKAALRLMMKGEANGE